MKESISVALHTCFPGPEAHFASPQAAGYRNGTLPVRLRKVQNEIQGKPMPNKLYFSLFPNYFSDTVGCLLPCLKHSFTLYLYSTCKTQGSGAITVKVIAESKCGKGVEAEETDDYSSSVNLFRLPCTYSLSRLKVFSSWNSIFPSL